MYAVRAIEPCASENICCARYEAAWNLIILRAYLLRELWGRVKSKYIAKIFVARAMRPREIELYCENICCASYEAAWKQIILRKYLLRELWGHGKSNYIATSLFLLYFRMQRANSYLQVIHIYHNGHLHWSLDTALAITSIICCNSIFEYLFKETN